MLVMPDVDDVYSVSSASVVVPLQPSQDLVSCCCCINRPATGVMHNIGCQRQALCDVAVCD